MSDSNKSREGTKEIRIYGIQPSVAQTLENIADNLGVTVTQYLKPKIRDIVDSAPDHLKKPIKD